MSLLFTGDFANPDEPLWLRAYGPVNPPSNLQVSTLTVNSQGGIAMRSDGAVYPNTDGAPVAFNRANNSATDATELRQVPSRTVPTKAIESTYLAATDSGGLSYDDMAMAGLQIYGNVATFPFANQGCAGYLTQGPLPFTTRLYTGGFSTDIFSARIGNFSTVNISTGTVVIPSPLVISTLIASTINANTGRFSTLSVSNLEASTLAVSSLVISGTVFSTIGVSTLTAINAIVSNATISTISSGTIVSGIGSFSTLNALKGNISNISSGTGTFTNVNGTFGNISTLVTNLEIVNDSFISTLLAPNIQAVTVQTIDIIAGTVFSAAIRSSAPNAFISTGNIISPNVVTSSIGANNINTSSISTGLANVTFGNFSTLAALNFSTISTTSVIAGLISTPTVFGNNVVAGNVSSFNVSTNTLFGKLATFSTLSTPFISVANLTGSNVSSFNVSTNSIYANVATFSTLNAPAGSVTVSTINTGLVSTSVAVVKDLFLSSMVFNASLSPNFSLDMGGVVAGLIGSGANAIGIGLGVANLATGIAGLAMPRQAGGINPTIFQTVNGTSQLQYSTLGAVTQTTFVSTDSSFPNNLPGNIIFTSTFISTGTYCMRTISDPINLANANGQAGQGIQGFSEWTPVQPADVIPGSVGAPNKITNRRNANFIDFGTTSPPILEVFAQSTIRFTAPRLEVTPSTVIFNTRQIDILNTFGPPVTQVNLTGNLLVQGNLDCRSTLFAKQIQYDSFGTATPIQVKPGFIMSTLAVSSLVIGVTVSGDVQVSTITSLGFADFAVAGTGGVTVGSNATAPNNGNSLSVAGDISAQGGFDIDGGGIVRGPFYTETDTSIGFTDPSSIVTICESGGSLQIGSIASAAINTVSSFGTYTHIGSTIMQGGNVLNGITVVNESLTSRRLGSTGITNNNSGWLPQPSTFIGAYENKMLLGPFQFLWGHTATTSFQGGTTSFTFSNAFSTGTLAWMLVNGDAQTNTFANGSATASNTWAGAAANLNGSGATNALNYFAIGIAP